MPAQLRVSIGQRSDKGRKEVNQDFHGAYVPDEPQLSAKGVAVALADGIGSSDVSHVASETAVAAFLDDYLSTSDAWSTKKSAQRVLTAINSWLYAQTRRSRYRHDRDRGYVCTFSGLVIKSTTAHVFHAGDARVYRLRNGALEQLTDDHRLWISQSESYLNRALGADSDVSVDYTAAPAAEGDVFVLATDGVHEHADPALIIDAVNAHGDDLDRAAHAIVAAAFERGSRDNLTTQIVRIDALPGENAEAVFERSTALPFPPALDARMTLDGYEIVREIHTSSRSYVYLARDRETGAHVALKVPASDLRDDRVLLERFLIEEWIARRINSPHVAKPFSPQRKRNYLYVVMEYIGGRSLTQWMLDNPSPDIETVRSVAEQIGKGLLAFHRQEMVHQDLRPDNVLIDDTGTAKIIDFGAAEVAGISESAVRIGRDEILGTEQYAAPEYFLGERGSPASDVFSLGVVTYQMLTGALPYGPQVPKARSRAAQRKLRYCSAIRYNRDVPVWIDGALRKAVHPDPEARYAEVSELMFDLRHPRKEFLNETRPPLIERHPERFWQGVSLLLALVIVALLVVISRT